jgi:hypothetical protein
MSAFLRLFAAADRFFFGGKRPVTGRFFVVVARKNVARLQQNPSGTSMVGW